LVAEIFLFLLILEIIMIKAVLFDLDGTLVDSIVDLANGLNFGLESYGFPTHPIEAYKIFVGNGIPKTIERALPEGMKTKENIEKVQKVFFEHYSVHFADNTKAYDGICELVDELISRGLKVAVITNKAQGMADVVVKKAVGDKFSCIFGKRDGIPSKPDPTSAHIVMSELSVNPDECVFLGDSCVDMGTAVNCGALPVGERWGYRDEQELWDNGAKYIINKPIELIKIIEEING